MNQKAHELDKRLAALSKQLEVNGEPSDADAMDVDNFQKVDDILNSNEDSETYVIENQNQELNVSNLAQFL